MITKGRNCHYTTLLFKVVSFRPSVAFWNKKSPKSKIKQKSPLNTGLELLWYQVPRAPVGTVFGHVHTTVSLHCRRGKVITNFHLRGDKVTGQNIMVPYSGVAEPNTKTHFPMFDFLMFIYTCERSISSSARYVANVYFPA